MLNEQMNVSDDRLNGLFLSSVADDLIQFYKSFDSCQQVIRWMRKRPRGVADIKEIQGNKEYVVVIPTKDSGGELATYCKDQLFNGLQIVFVESGSDPHFNFAQNCNAGIKYALNLNPKWIILSNDDMYRIDDILVLIDQLDKLDHETVKAVLPKTVLAGPPKSKVALPVFVSLGESTIVRNILFRIGGRLWRERLRFLRKFEVRLVVAPASRKYGMLYRIKRTFPGRGDFVAFSSKYVKSCNGELLDDTFINGYEDIDLFWRLDESKGCLFADFRVGSREHMSLGEYDITRRMRNVVNEVYLNYKIRKGLLSVPSN